MSLASKSAPIVALYVGMNLPVANFLMMHVFPTLWRVVSCHCCVLKQTTTEREENQKEKTRSRTHPLIPKKTTFTSFLFGILDEELRNERMKVDKKAGTKRKALLSSSSFFHQNNQMKEED